MSYWPKIVRPTGVLIFVESIAWFLLRQYRALVEDYKWFYRLYLKRANYLAALRILSPNTMRPEEVFVAVSLIQEDLSRRLKSVETIESIEKLKPPEESPVTEILRMLTNVKDKAKVKNPKSTVDKGALKGLQTRYRFTRRRIAPAACPAVRGRAGSGLAGAVGSVRASGVVGGGRVGAMRGWACRPAARCGARVWRRVVTHR
jgi:hypothetical protein